MKYALIMGASGDIGQACALQLAQDGWSLYCHYYQQRDKVQRLVERLQKEYPQQDFFTVQWDMQQEHELKRFSENLFQVDSIVFANGGTSYKLLTELTSIELDQLWQVHVKSPIQLCQKLEPKLSRKRIGRIVFIGSVYGSVGSAMEVGYSTVKGAQQAFAKAYAQEAATYGITVNVVAPGAIDTHMNQKWTDAERAALQADIPTQRLGKPEEVAAVVGFLVGDQASYITGTIIPISGGWKV